PTRRSSDLSCSRPGLNQSAARLARVMINNRMALLDMAGLLVGQNTQRGVLWAGRDSRLAPSAPPSSEMRNHWASSPMVPAARADWVRASADPFGCRSARDSHIGELEKLNSAVLATASAESLKSLA